MDADEQLICDYLKTWPGQYVATRELARRAGDRRRFDSNPQWAAPVLARLVERGLVETDNRGHYRLLKKSTHGKEPDVAVDEAAAETSDPPPSP